MAEKTAIENFNKRCQEATVVPKKKECLTLSQSRQYVLDLINTERKQRHMQCVTLDTLATKVGQAHAENMARFGFCAHWDTHGTKPWQRYSDATGKYQVGENCSLMNADKPLSQPPSFFPRAINLIQNTFTEEKPPNDGHLQQMLDPAHNRVGIGIAYFQDVENHSRLALTEEFIDDYGVFDPVPKIMHKGQTLTASGELQLKVELYAIELRQEELPHSLSVKELNKTSHCAPPDLDHIICVKWPRAEDQHLTKNHGLKFHYQIRTEENWPSGLYYLIITAKLPNSVQPHFISIQTFRLD